MDLNRLALTIWASSDILLVKLELSLQADSHSLRHGLPLVLVKQLLLLFNFLLLLTSGPEVEVQVVLEQAIAADGHLASTTIKFNLLCHLVAGHTVLIKANLLFKVVDIQHISV